MKITRQISKFVTILLIVLISGCGSITSYTDSISNKILDSDEQYLFSKPSASWKSMVGSNDGYYFFSGINNYFLYFVDKKNMKSVVLCNKPNCLHADESDPEKIANCNAFFMRAEEMIYYNSNLYIFESNASDIIQVSLDGTRRKVLYQFKEMVKFATIHRGYLYFSTSDEGTVSGNGSNEKTKCKLMRISLSDLGKQPELIYEYSGIGAQIHGIIGYENSVFFGILSFTNPTMKEHTGMLFNYDINNKTVNEIGNDMAGYSINGNKIVFNWDDRIYSCNFDGTDRKLLNQVNGYTYSDGNYILADTLFAKDEYGNRLKRRLDVFDLDGNKISSIDLGSIGREMMYGGDDNYLFIPDATSQKNRFGVYHILWAIDKHKLADGTARPVKIFTFVPKAEDKGVVTKIR